MTQSFAPSVKEFMHIWLPKLTLTKVISDMVTWLFFARGSPN
jgi:hypothetical protein